MEVWLIQDGERAGPFPSFEIERRIREGDISPDQPAWVEGMGKAWKPLGEIRQFRKVFEAFVDGPVESAPLAGAVAAPAVEPPALPAQAVTTAELMRRFWARWFDLHLFGLCWWAAMRWAGHDLVDLMSDMWVLVWQMLPWFAIEAMLIHLWGTTPGKALLGIRVAQANGKPPSIGASVWRSFRVWAMGLGLGMPLVVIFCQGLSFWISRRIGRPLWDTAGDHRVRAGRVSPVRVAVFVGLFMVMIGLRGWVLMPAVEELYGEQLESIRSIGADTE
jgi:uncharacterized RDD family membrane protein YckC